jgi:DNA repair ATPase RecN
MFASKKSYREKKEELARVRVQLHQLAIENKKLEQLIADSENASMISNHDYGLESVDDLASALSGMRKMLEAAEEKAERESTKRIECEREYGLRKHEYLQSAVSGMQTMLTETENQLSETVRKLEESEILKVEAETAFAKEIKEYETRIAYLESFVKPYEVTIEICVKEGDDDGTMPILKNGQTTTASATKSRGCGWY